MHRLLQATSWLLFAALLLCGPSLGFAAESPVDLNRATAEQLEGLDGIGAAKARAIIEFRDANGPFTNVEDLRQVRGIGDKLLAALKPQISVSAEPAPAAAPQR